MTDEEKAEEYSDNLDLVKERNPELKTNDDFIKQAYLDGLAEGRKELEQWKQEWQDAQIKANEEGFARTTLQIKYLELEKENEQLKCDLYNTEANLQGMTINCEKLENKNTELKEQIKEMKNDLFNVANKNTQTERLSAFWDMYHKYLD